MTEHELRKRIVWDELGQRWVLELSNAELARLRNKVPLDIWLNCQRDVMREQCANDVIALYGEVNIVAKRPILRTKVDALAAWLSE